MKVKKIKNHATIWLPIVENLMILELFSFQNLLYLGHFVAKWQNFGTKRSADPGFHAMW
jgi:hypothetical protein